MGTANSNFRASSSFASSVAREKKKETESKFKNKQTNNSAEPSRLHSSFAGKKKNFTTTTTTTTKERKREREREREKTGGCVGRRNKKKRRCDSNLTTIDYFLLYRDLLY